MCGDLACPGLVPVQVEDWTWSVCSTCGRQLEREVRFRYQETFGVVREVVDDNGGEYTCKTHSRELC